MLFGLIAHAMMGEWSIRAQSATFDEPVHLTAGWIYWQTRDYRYNEDHPPLSSLAAAAPLLASRPDFPSDHPFWLRPQWRNTVRQYGLAHAFLYPAGNEARGEVLVRQGRRAILFLTLAFLAFFHAAARRQLGGRTAWVPFLLAALCPAILAHGSLATTDALFAYFYFLFFYGLHVYETRSREEPGAPLGRAAFLTGAAGGLALASKFSALIMGPLALWWLVRQKKHGAREWRDRGLMLAGGAAAVLLAYQIAGLPDFFESLSWNLERLRGARSTFAAGRHSLGGWWWYFPLVFLLKTPAPVLLGLAALSWAAWKRRLPPPWFLIWPPLIYFLVACRSSIQIGHRHILPVYPFLYLALGFLVKAAWENKRARAAVFAGLAWTAAGTASALPFPLAYFNEIPALLGKKPHDFFVDSNLDWGQGLGALKKYLEKEKIGAVYLSYFGTADPHAYGIRYRALAPYTISPLPDDDVDVGREPKRLFVISATNYQTQYFADHAAFDWLHARRPEAVLGGSLLVFDVTEDEEFNRRFVLNPLPPGVGEDAAKRRERGALLQSGPSPVPSSKRSEGRDGTDIESSLSDGAVEPKPGSTPSPTEGRGESNL